MLKKVKKNSIRGARAYVLKELYLSIVSSGIKLLKKNLEERTRNL